MAYDPLKSEQHVERLEHEPLHVLSQLGGVVRVVYAGLADEPDGSELSLVSVVETMQGRGFGPLLLAPTLMVLLPTGAIPGVPTLSALLIMLVESLLVGKRWLS